MGEAPDQVRNCFQQRSRWTKGHFQIIFNPRHNPLFQRGLPLFDRLMYCSGTWCYFVGAVTTPTFIVVPLITIWIGFFVSEGGGGRGRRKGGNNRSKQHDPPPPPFPPPLSSPSYSPATLPWP